MTRALAQELPHGLATVSLNPSVIDIEILRSCLPEIAPNCIKPDSWAQGMVDFLLKLHRLAPHNIRAQVIWNKVSNNNLKSLMLVILLIVLIFIF